MASIYVRKDSPWIWIRYRNDGGKWVAAATEYRKDNIGDRRQAKLLARRKTELELAHKVSHGSDFSEWVIPWLTFKYGNKQSSLEAYKRCWRNIETFLIAQKCESARAIKRDFAQRYLLWRTGADPTSHNPRPAGRNTAIQEIKIMSMILTEAVHMGHINTNPLSRLGLKKDRSPGKELWSDEQIRRVAQHLEKTKCHWQKVTFYFGLYQACRLRQCQIPLKCIRFDLGTIQYPDIIVKGGEAFSQPIDPRFLPILNELVAAAKRMKLDRICEVKWDASLTWRTTLDRLGFETISHHGLRATWITRAAENNVPESLAMAFCHHSSAEVHRIYKKVSTASLVGVSSAVPLPSFQSADGDEKLASGSLQAKPGNGEDVSSSRIQTRNRARNRLRFATALRPETQPTPPSSKE